MDPELAADVAVFAAAKYMTVNFQACIFGGYKI